MATKSEPQTPQAPVQPTSAEGHVIPTTVERAVLPTAVPTPEDRQKEWNTWKAARTIYIGPKVAFPMGRSVPASHPMLEDGDHGQGWIARGWVEKVEQA